MKKISIIIPAYNVEFYLEKCLETCVTQSLIEIEIIVVNDGSSDNTERIIKKFLKYENLISVYQDNAGVVKAREKGLSIATGEYIFYLDGDDFLPTKDILKKMYYLGKSKDYDIVFGDINSLDEELNFIEKINYGASNFKTGQELLHWILENKVGYLWGKLIKRRLYKENRVVKFSNLKYCEDLIEILQLVNFSKSVVKIDFPTYNYLQRGNSVCKTSVEFKTWSKRYKKILMALDILINSEIFLGLGKIKLKRLYLFYSVLFIWFNNGFNKNDIGLKLNITSLFKEQAVKKLVWTESEKWFFITFFTINYPKLSAKGYGLFSKYYLKKE